MTRLPRLLIALLCLLPVWVAPALADPGDVVERHFALGPTRVPLPAGSWTVAADITDGDGAGRMRSVVLVSVSGRRVAGVVLARGNTQTLTAIPGATAECERSDIYLAYTAYDTPQDGLCVFANLVADGGAVAPVWTAALAWLRGRDIAVGKTWLMAGFRARVRSRMLDVRYHFPPPFDTDGAEGWAASPWSPAHAGGTSRRANAVAQLTVWAAWMRGPVEAGVRGQVGEEILPPMPFGGPDLLPALIAARLRPLEALRGAGAIGAEDFAAQARVLARVEIVPDRSEMPLWLRSMWKTVTYRVGSIADSLAVSYLVLGSVTQMLGFAVVGELIRPPAVYLHEMAWARSGIGRAAAPSRPQELPDIGATR